MRVVVERSPGEDRTGWWAYRWDTGPHTGLLWVEADGDRIDAPQDRHDHITALLLLWRHRLETSEWPERIEYAPQPPPVELDPARREPVQRRRRSDDGPALRPRTLGQQADRAKRGKT